MHTVGPGIWLSLIHILARQLKIMDNEKHPLDELKNDEITEKSEKKRNAHCRTWNMARILKISENEKTHFRT